MRIMVSACLAGENCKYNGGNNRSEKILRLMEENEVITVCPEQMGGLPTPRVPSEVKTDMPQATPEVIKGAQATPEVVKVQATPEVIKGSKGVVTARDGRIVDAQFRAGAQKCLEIALREKPDLIVLQPRSPSCGVKQRYDGTFTGTLTDGAGVTAQLLMENGFRCIDAEDLAQVRDGIMIRKLYNKEKDLLKDFLYEAIFIPEGVEPPARDIVEQPELKIYYEYFGSGAADHCLVAEAEGRVVGAVWTRIMNDYGHVDDETPSFAISLSPEYRGRGIGTELMREMLAILKEQGYKKASLAVQKANYAVRMYRKVGFEITDENEEEFIMVCRL